MHKSDEQFIVKHRWRYDYSIITVNHVIKLIWYRHSAEYTRFKAKLLSYLVPEIFTFEYDNIFV
jgi:hypothetical protein